MVVCRPLPSPARTAPVSWDANAGEGVDERGFPGARRTQQHQGAAGRQVTQQFVESVAVLGRGGDDVDAGRLAHHRPDDVVRHVREVRLRDDHERRGSRVPGRDEGPFQPVVRERTVHRDNDADDVHVGAEHLRLGGGLEGTLAAQF